MPASGIQAEEGAAGQREVGGFWQHWVGVCCVFMLCQLRFMVDDSGRGSPDPLLYCHGIGCCPTKIISMGQ